MRRLLVIIITIAIAIGVWIAIGHCGSYTDNINLYKPDRGDTGWGDSMNSNFDIIDTQLSEAHDHTATPTYDIATANAIYATNTLHATRASASQFSVSGVILDRTEWANLDGQDQAVLTTSDVTFGTVVAGTVNTGQGANELYDMDQNVLTTSEATFNTATLTYLYVGSNIVYNSSNYRWNATGEYRQVNLPLLDFTAGISRLVATANVLAWPNQIPGTSTPYLVLGRSTCDYILWQSQNTATPGAIGATDVAQISFRVPDDYSTGAQFLLGAANDIGSPHYMNTSTGTPCSIAWTYALADGTLATSLQPEVSVANDEFVTPQQIALTMRSPEDIEGGDVVVLELWASRLNIEDATVGLRIYDADFRYRALY